MKIVIHRGLEKEILKILGTIKKERFTAHDVRSQLRLKFEHLDICDVQRAFSGLSHKNLIRLSGAKGEGYYSKVTGVKYGDEQCKQSGDGSGADEGRDRTEN